MKVALKTILMPSLFVSIIFNLAGCGGEKVVDKEVVKKNVTVEAAILEQSPSYSIKREYVGVVTSGQKAKLGFELGGKVAEIYVDLGDEVESGTPLIRLDTQLLKTEENQLKAQKRELNSQLKLVTTNLERQNSLKAKGFSAEAEIDALNSEKGVLLSSLQGVDAAIAANQLRQNKSIIRAPYSGTIAHRHVSLGDVVSIGAPTMTLLADKGKEAFIGIPAKQLDKVAQVNAPFIRVGGESYDVSLLKSGAMVDTHSRTVGLRYLLPDDVNALEGQLAYLDFEEEHLEQGFWVPIASLTDGMRGVWNVYVINDAKRIESRAIQVLFADHNRAFVKGGLCSGEKVVASGLHRIVPGQQVDNIKLQ